MIEDEVADTSQQRGELEAKIEILKLLMSTVYDNCNYWYLLLCMFWCKLLVLKYLLL